MGKRIDIIGVRPKKLDVLDQSKRRIDPPELAAALDANPTGQRASLSLDPIALAELGTQLLHRLRSSGGRPAIADATVNCRVPFSAEDIKTLEYMVVQIGGSTGTKPSIGQLVSVIVHRCLAQFDLDTNMEIALASAGTEPGVNLPAWRRLFPSILDLPGVANRAKLVAEREMPLMMADAA